MVVVVSTLLTTRYVPRIKNHVGAGILPTWSLQAHGVYWQLYDSLCKLELELELALRRSGGGGKCEMGGLSVIRTRHDARRRDVWPATKSETNDTRSRRLLPWWWNRILPHLLVERNFPHA